MIILSKLMVFHLTVLSLFCSFVTILTNPVVAGEPIIDKNCRYHQRTPENLRKVSPENRASIYFTSGFHANHQKLFLQVLKFPDATSIFCILSADYQTNKRLHSAKMIQNKLIEKVEKLSAQDATYIVTVKGDKHENIFRTFYKLNLRNPRQPQMIPLIQIYKSYSHSL